MRKQKIAVSVAVVMWGVTSGASALTSAPTDAVKGRAPTLDSASFTYTDANGNSRVDVNDTLQIVETGFGDLDGDASETSEYKWYRDGTPIVGATGNSYTLVAVDLGTKITASVIPQTDSITTDPYQGTQVAVSGAPDGDDSVDVVDPNEVDAVEIVIAATDAALAGNPIVSTELRAKVTTSAGNIGTATDYTYQWMIEDSVGAGTYSPIAGVTSETYTPGKDDQKRKLQVDVTKR